VNIVGPGIFDAAGGQEDLDEILDDLYSGESSCTYKGVLSPFVPTSSGSGSAELTLNVPVGSSRVVQVAGASPSSGSCNFDVDGEIDLFEWGRAITGIFGPTNISVTAHPDTTSGLPMREMKCGGGDAIESTEGKLLWFAAEDLCQGISDGVVAPSSWNSRIPGDVFMSRSGAVTCESSNGRRAARSDAAAEKFFGSFTNNDPRTGNLEGLTAFVVSKYLGTSAGYGVSLSLSAGSDLFQVKHQYFSSPSPYSMDELSVSIGPLVTINNGSSQLPYSTLRVFGARAKQGVGAKFRVKDNSNLFENFSSATLLRYNSLNYAMVFDVSSSVAANESVEVYEVLVFNRALSDQEFDRVFSQLRNKYGISP
jgi:hypothetical protein